MEFIQTVLANIEKVDQEAGQSAQNRLDSLSKPPGSLGVLEKVAVKLAAIQSNPMPIIGKKVVMIMASDHGVVEEGFHTWPQEVTRQMVHNFLNRGAAINVLAKQYDAEVVVTDTGIIGEPIIHPDLNVHKIRPGTRNMVKGPAMTRMEVSAAINIGIDLAEKEIRQGASIIATGEMGIGNTTPSSAILACYSQADLEVITGRGTGLDDIGLIKKRAAIEKALELNQPNPADPLDVLMKVGGYEIAALTGVIIGAAANKVPLLLDGFISTASALIACKLNGLIKDYIFASHLSQEPGHRIMLQEIGLKPMLYLDLRLGEGTGAVLALGLFEAATRIMHEMATFDEAGVSSR